MRTMGILQAQNISLSFGDRTILKDTSFVLGEHARAALAGGNGEGKSTLMKIIVSQMHSDDGKLTMTRGMRISYLPQSDIVLSSNTVYEEIEHGFDHYRENLDRQHEIENLLVSNPTDALLMELNELQEKLLDGTYYSREQIIFRIAKGLGFSESDLRRPCSEFSGGFQMRIALARILAQEPDLMMLDEPTNYLDIEARLYLKDFLKTFKGSLFIVCHDKGFLDDTVNEVYELFHGKLTRYSGNYTFYENQRRLELEQLESAYERQMEQIEKTEQFIERFRYKATKAKQVQSRIKALEKTQIIEVPSHLKKLSFSFPPSPHSPNDVVVIENLTKHYSDLHVFDDFSMTVNKGQRLSVTGHNGIGKSTLLRIIAGLDPDYSGVCRLGPNVRIGYFAQDTADTLNRNNTILEEVLPYGSEGQMRNALGSFLFSGDDIYKKIGVLSGGERSRLALLKILLQPASLLILDEPTNHLDINSKDMLLKALKEYDGTIIFVSHDAYFIKAIADRILYLSEDSPMLIEGDYDYFEYRMSTHLGLDVKEAKPQMHMSIQEENRAFKDSFGFTSQEDRALANRKRNQRQKLKREADALLEKTGQLELRIAEIKALMNIAENYSDPLKITKLSAELGELERQKEETEELWMLRTEELEECQ